ncbi:hypothetical protein WJX81_001723 [Elliptochloris bilobata]|uniref:Uncharacterized protein n=1 Tax=Elliptochloris bilobata TaxID=381761 RepID=A0AAW1RIF0_9CHLO
MSRRTGLAALYGLLLRIFALACFAIGVAFIAFGCVLENPPKQLVSGALAGLGSFALATSAFGWFAPGLGPRLVAAYLIASALLTFLQVVLVLGIFGAQQKVAVAVAQTDTTGRYTEAYVTEKLKVGKWVLLWIVLAECVSLCAAGALHWLRPEANPYADMTQEQVDELHTVELQGIQGKLASGGARAQRKGQSRLDAKIIQKYGKHMLGSQGARWFTFWR